MKNWIIGAVAIVIGSISFIGANILSTMAKASTRSSLVGYHKNILKASNKVKHVQIKLKHGVLNYTIMPNSDLTVNAVVNNQDTPDPVLLVDNSGFRIYYDPRHRAVFMRNSSGITYYVSDSFWGNTPKLGVYSLVNYPNGTTNLTPFKVVTNQYMYLTPTGLENADYSVSSVNSHMYIQDITMTTDLNGSFYRCDGNIQQLWQPDQSASVEGILMACDKQQLVGPSHPANKPKKSPHKDVKVKS